MKKRTIKPESAGQAVADFVIRQLTRRHLASIALVPACLALCAILPVTVSASEPVSENAPAEHTTALPVAGIWNPTGSLKGARAIHTATLLPNGLVLVAGGLNPRSVETRTAELYDPASGTWTPTGGLNQGRFYYPATLLPDGKVLVEGGDSLAGERASAEL